MIKSRFVDDCTIEVIAQDGEKFIWKTYFPTPQKDQKYYAERLAYYFENYAENASVTLGYWIWIKMNYDEGLGISGGKGDRDEERIFLYEERLRIGKRIRDLRKERGIEAKALAKAVNIDAANLSRIEQGRYSVGVDILSRIAFVLGTRMDFVKSDNSAKNFTR